MVDASDHMGGNVRLQRHIVLCLCSRHAIAEERVVEYISTVRYVWTTILLMIMGESPEMVRSTLKWNNILHRRDLVKLPIVVLGEKPVRYMCAVVHQGSPTLCSVISPQG